MPIVAANAPRRFVRLARTEGYDHLRDTLSEEQQRLLVIPDELDDVAAGLFEALRAHRLEVARTEGVPPYVVASDRTLRDVAILRPRDMTELLTAHGIGPTKAERYGEGLLSVIAQH